MPYKERWRHSSPGMMRGFAEAGFSALSMASNVSAERQAVCDTIETAAELGMPICGIGRNRAAARRPAIVKAAGQRVALLSRTSVYWPNVVAAGDELPGAATVKAHTAYVPGRRALEMPGAPPEVRTWADETELAELIDDIEAAKAEADLVVLSMHWGISSCADVIDYQRQIARAAIDAGADLIFGHHAHLVQPIEMYRGKPIFYGLGNFAFDWEKMRGRKRDGIVVTAEIDAERRRFTVSGVRRDEANDVAMLGPGDAAWREIVGFIETNADQALREVMEPGEAGIVIEAGR